MAYTKEDLLDDRTTLSNRVAAVQMTLDNHAPALPTVAVPMSKEQLNLEIEELQAVKIELDQLQKLTRRLDRADTANVMDTALAETKILIDAWKSATLQAHQINIALSAHVTSRVKIPKAEPPSFDGQSANWQAFLDQFNSMVVTNNQVSATDKLSLLKKSLEKGSAHHIVQNFPLTDIDWTNAWAAVQSRYNHERELAYSHLAKLFELTPISYQTQTGIRNIIDTVNEVTRALKNLNVNTDTWDLFIIYIVRKNLDNRTRTDFEKSLTDDKLHSLKVLTDYLNNLATALGTAAPSDKSSNAKGAKSFKSSIENNHSSKDQTHFDSATSLPGKSKISCVFCNQSHWNSKCPTLLLLTPVQRQKLAGEKKLCKNCLRLSNENHKTSTCNAAPCGLNGCQGKHHHLLHMEPRASSNTISVGDTKQELVPTTVTLSSTHTDSGLNVLLSTAIVNILLCNKSYRVRALIDQGSQVNLMTEKLANRLQLKRIPSTVNITGIGNFKSNFAHGLVTIQIQSILDSKWKTQINCYILPEVTGEKPTQQYNITNFDQFKNLRLADETFNQPGPVDIILGAQVFVDIIGDNHIKGEPSAIDTKLGYLITGQVNNREATDSASTLTCDVDFDLARFWQQEEIPESQQLSTEEREVEAHFERTHTRDVNGKFKVELPFLEDHKLLGESRFQAQKRLIQLENKLIKYPDKKILYHTAMKVYIENGFIQEVQLNHKKFTTHDVYYLPHHFVEKESSTTSFRVVFDGSAKTTSGVSLNDILHAGPNLQKDLVTILLRFRKHKYVFSADIQKMYLQIGIHKHHQDFLRLLWRESPQKPINEYRFTVVPFGLSSSPYLALTALQHLANQEKINFPLGADALLNDFYVDDCLSGATKIETALETQQELLKLLLKGGFKLRKWSSNHPSLLKSIPPENRETKLPLELESTDKIKTLGILWNPATDTFSFKIKPQTYSEFTKRQVASYAAKTYDPTGLIQPVIIQAKIILQDLWESKVGWDQNIPPEIKKKWEKYLDELPYLEKIQIPRHFTPHDSVNTIFHGFCDASKKAYGAAVYIVGISAYGNTSALLTSKSKVSPLKLVTTPRLELMGAVLLVKLTNSIMSSLRNKPNAIHFWSDSSIVLNQISKPSRKFKTFVGNRVSYVQEHSAIGSWHYVKTEENPADLVSRGVHASDLFNNKLWWNGPYWLQTNILPIGPIPGCFSTTDIEEIPHLSVCTFSKSYSWVDDTLQKFNSLMKLQRTTVFILRRFKIGMTPKPRTSNLMTVSELQISLACWIKLVQARHFEEELSILKKGQAFPKGNKIKSLAPFIDFEGILRVGGRLNEATEIPEERKHPVFLPKNHRIGTLIIQDIHYRFKHAGPLLMMSIIRSQYWILGLKPSLNRCIKNCITCQRITADVGKQMMGNLPKSRISVARAFLHTGIDYTGPILVLPKSGRGQKTIKSWIAVFICLTTKAIHLELVSELSTSAFMAALKRFSSQRGKPQVMYSDEGTNFTGSRNEMIKFQQEMEAIANHHDVACSLAKDGILWKLNPPGSPYMGGLWEAAVKSMKHHLRRAAKATNFTIEEMYTLLCEIEACLNSRPLTPMSNDPSDFSVLTPGHFLIGEPLAAVPGQDFTQNKMNRLDRWEIIQQQTTHFWNRWSSEYLHTLQNRPKWLAPKTNFKVNDLVIIKDESLAPLKWKMGRIIETHPGKDGQVRVATVKTATIKIVRQEKNTNYLDKFQSNISILRRPVHKLVRLPYDNLENNDT